MRMIMILSAAALLTSASALGQDEFEEFPAGDPVEVNHMEIAAVYLMAVDMEPRGVMRPASQSDIHLEADIHATPGNPNGFGAGEWIPYLEVEFELTNRDTGETQSGVLLPMVAVDGPHYGNNITMAGPGTYDLTFTVYNPEVNGFARHTDAATGVEGWFEPFTVDYSFDYVPVQ